MLVEMFQPVFAIMSLLYHIGNGWDLEAVVDNRVRHRGAQPAIYNGLRYPTNKAQLCHRYLCSS
jgi:hypothetical protein